MLARYAVVIAALVSLLVTALLGLVVIPWLRKLKYGQTINEIGPKWHLNKQGIPTMGGLMFIAGSIVGVFAGLLALHSSPVRVTGGGISVVLLGLFAALAFSAIGFFDDYIKVVKKRNLGLRALQKVALQSVVAIGFMLGLHFLNRLSTFVVLPVVGSVNFGIFYYPLAYCIMIFVVNAVNLTDGLDGLASSVTLWVMCGWFVCMIILGEYRLSVWSSALAGGCLGFLVWNYYPAKVFMGDVGSMFLGGAVVALGFCSGRPDLLLILGLVYIIEAVSVVIQVAYFKITKGKRLFKMTPIHHHFELMEWSEVKIDTVFAFAAFVCAILACIYAFLSA